MKALMRISAPLANQVISHQAPAVVLDESGAVIFGNDAWLTYQKKNGVPPPYGIGSSYEIVLPIPPDTAAGRYVRATIDQGVSEVRIGVQPLFTKDCSTLTDCGPISYRLTVIRCPFEDGGAGVVILCECAAKPCLCKPRASRHRRQAA
ncbi:hypothetical protein G3A43_07735 [Paraburkholderia aspalathi]|nr:hypothetical protein [Paraburkholderia aspalathi]MBK3780146.1 hypothetical protein [Paraburkholderia aspalathi]